MDLQFVEGDLLEQEVDVIVNAWNRNIIPWWLLWPQGVSGAIKRRAGTAPFRELARTGALPLGQARLTSAGRLPYRGIIHVAGIDMTWRASEQSVRDSVANALGVARDAGFASLAMPTIGAGTGGLGEARVLEITREAAASSDYVGEVRVVVFAAGGR